jgi:hypothetical protein
MNRLERNIGVPALLETLLLLVLLGLAVTEDLGSKLIADDAGLIISVAFEWLCWRSGECAWKTT